MWGGNRNIFTSETAIDPTEYQSWVFENDLSVSLPVCLSACPNSSVFSVAKGYSCLCVCETKEEGVRTPYLPCQPCHIYPTNLTLWACAVVAVRNIDTLGLFTRSERLGSKADRCCRVVIHVHTYPLCACPPLTSILPQANTHTDACR